jgi:hypothetical protein
VAVIVVNMSATQPPPPSILCLTPHTQGVSQKLQLTSWPLVVALLLTAMQFYSYFAAW